MGHSSSFLSIGSDHTDEFVGWIQSRWQKFAGIEVDGIDLPERPSTSWRRKNCILCDRGGPPENVKYFVGGYKRVYPEG